MKKVFTFLLLIITISYGKAQSNVGIQFQEDSIYLGRIPMQDIEYRFDFQVERGKTVQIKEVKPDCACAVASYPKEKLAAHSINTVMVSFSPYKPGPFEKTFQISWEGTAQTSTLLLRGYIEPDEVPLNLDFSQNWGSLRLKNRIVNLGNISDDLIVKRRIEVYNPNEFPISFLDSIIKPNYVETIFESKQIEPKGMLFIDVFYHPELKNSYGYSLDNIQFFTDDIFNPKLELDVSSNIYAKSIKDKRSESPQIWVNTDTLSIGKVFNNGHFMVSFIIYNKGEKDLNIQRVIPSDNCEIISIDKKSIKKGEYASIKVKVFDMAKEAGKQYRTIEVYSNDPFQPILPLTIVADVVK